jgi:predicted ABC-type ATPase
MKYVGLATPELHIARVRERVARGGHDIPEDKIRQRFVSSRANLIRLLPALTSLDLYDNSAHSPPGVGRLPRLQLLLRTERGRLAWMADRDAIPEWARPIAASALTQPRM